MIPIFFSAVNFIQCIEPVRSEFVNIIEVGGRRFLVRLESQFLDVLEKTRLSARDGGFYR